MLKAIIYRVSAMVIAVTAALMISPTITYKTSLEAYEAETSNFVGLPQPNTIVATIVAKEDDRPVRLASFLAARGSPMAADATSLVQIADKYGLDWKLLPAIAGVESTFGRAVPARSYNPYGWSNGKYRFKNWVDATETVAAGIRIRYAPFGEVTPWRIGRSYAASPTWAARVNSFMRLIASFK